MPNSSPDTDYLTGLRGLAALFVVVAHCSNLGMHVVPGVDLNSTAKAGVWVFFVLSAYLLTQRLKFLLVLDGKAALAQYAVRRFLRIMPLYLTYLVLAAITLRMDVYTAFQHAVLVRGDDHLWTIPVEMTFYALLPIICALILSLKNDVRFVATLGVVAASVIVYFAADPKAISTNSLNVMNYLPFFTVGIALAFCPDFSIDRRFNFALIAIAILGMVAASPRSLELLGYSISKALEYSVIFAVLIPVLMFGIRREKTLRSLLSAPLFIAFGNWSFAIYLFHYEILRMVHATMIPGTLKGLAAVAVTLALAWVLTQFDGKFSAFVLKGRRPMAMTGVRQ